MKKFVMTMLVAVSVLGTLVGGLAPTQAQDTIEITFVHIFPDERDVRRETIAAVAEAFMAQNPGVVVNVESTTDDYTEVFEGALRAAGQGNAPHVIQVEDSLVQIAIDSQMFIKLSDYASDEQRATISDIIAPLRNFYDVTEDDFWGLPWNASNPVMYINPDIFTAAGLDPETPPQTFDEVVAACETIMAAEIEGIEGCINWPVNSWLPEQWVAMQGGMMVNNDNGRSARPTETNLDSPELLRVLTWWKELADSGYFIYSGSPNAYTPEGLLFVAGRTAMHVSTSAGISNILNYAPLMGQFTPLINRLPLPDADATNGVTAGGASVWVMAGHPDAETQAAVDFLFFLVNTENIAAWHQASGYFPTRYSSIEQLEAAGWFDENPYYRIPLDQMLAAEPNTSNAGMRVGASQQVREAVIQAALSVVDSGEDPAEALAAAKERADKALQDYNDVIGG